MTDSHRRLERAEQEIKLMRLAWACHLPNISIEDAIRTLKDSDDHLVPNDCFVSLPGSPQPVPINGLNGHTQETSPAEFSNAEQYEFDESKEFDNTTDGMGSLVVEPSKAGYTGPQSGVAALKFLQALPLCIPTESGSPLSLDAPDASDATSATAADVNRYIDHYFLIYHTAYPILHEATFRARVFGKRKCFLRLLLMLTASRCTGEAARWLMAYSVQHRLGDRRVRRRRTWNQVRHTILQIGSRTSGHGHPGERLAYIRSRPRAHGQLSAETQQAKCWVRLDRHRMEHGSRDRAPSRVRSAKYDTFHYGTSSQSLVDVVRVCVRRPIDSRPASGLARWSQRATSLKLQRWRSCCRHGRAA